MRTSRSNKMKTNRSSRMKTNRFNKMRANRSSKMRTYRSSKMKTNRFNKMKTIRSKITHRTNKCNIITNRFRMSISHNKLISFQRAVTIQMNTILTVVLLPYKIKKLITRFFNGCISNFWTNQMTKFSFFGMSMVNCGTIGYNNAKTTLLTMASNKVLFLCGFWHSWKNQTKTLLTRPRICKFRPSWPSIKTKLVADTTPQLIGVGEKWRYNLSSVSRHYHMIRCCGWNTVQRADAPKLTLWSTLTSGPYLTMFWKIMITYQDGSATFLPKNQMVIGTQCLRRWKKKYSALESCQGRVRATATLTSGFCTGNAWKSRAKTRSIYSRKKKNSMMSCCTIIWVYGMPRWTSANSMSKNMACRPKIPEIVSMCGLTLSWHT